MRGTVRRGQKMTSKITFSGIKHTIVKASSEITDTEREVAMASVELLNDYYREKNWIEEDFTLPEENE